MVNYLARLGWSHGDDEIFSREQFIEWFNLDHLGKSAAQFDEAKLRWVNAQHLKAMADDKLAERRCASSRRKASRADDAAWIARGCGLFKDRCNTLVELAGWLQRLVTGGQPGAEDAGHACDRCRAPGARQTRRSPGRGRVEQGRDFRSHQASAGRHRPEDAAARDAGACAGDGHAADAVTGRDPGAHETRRCGLPAQACLKD